MNQSKEMARIAYNALNDKKGEDIKIIETRDLVWLITLLLPPETVTVR